MSGEERADAISDHIDELGFIQGELLDRCLTMMFDTWDDSAESFNPGQQTIYVDDVVPALFDLTQNWLEDWPYVDIVDYEDACYSCFDPEVMDRAFSDSIQRPEEQMQEDIDRAQEIDFVIQFLEDLLSEIGF